MKKLLLSLYHYFCFFLFMAFLITCCMLLFLSTMSKTMGIVLDREDIRTAAILTFGNVVFLSLLCTVIDAVRRKLTVDRPVKRIVSATERIAKGDYSVRIAPLHGFHRGDGLDQIIGCFNQMARELSGVESLQADFIANVSHELKTPLAVMQNYGTLLQQADLPEEERLHYARAITDASRRLADLVTNILKLNKLENQQIYPSAQTYDLTEQLCRCLLDFEDQLAQKQIRLQTDALSDRQVLVNADPELLSLVWSNLISNAVKFTQPGGEIALSAEQVSGSVYVTVSDTGCGISAEVGRHIFEKFYQGDPSHATQGNGLGLALVRRVIDIVGGEISVGSTVGEGSTFTVKLRSADNGEV